MKLINKINNMNINLNNNFFFKNKNKIYWKTFLKDFFSNSIKELILIYFEKI